LEGALNDEVADCCEVSNVQKDTHEHNDRVLKVVEDRLEVLADGAEEDYAHPGPT